MAKGKTIKAKIRRAIFAATVYQIWLERNSRMHHGIPRTEQQVVEQIWDFVQHKRAMKIGEIFFFKYAL